MKRFCKTPEQRFMSKWEPVTESGCWVWLNYCDKKGYAKFGRELAHRVSYELFKGPIGRGLTIDHLCRVHSCVNPDHLEVVTHQVNIRRSDSPSAQNARKTHCIKGHELVGENIYWETTRRGLKKRHCWVCMRMRDKRRCKRGIHAKT